MRMHPPLKELLAPLDRLFVPPLSDAERSEASPAQGLRPVGPRGRVANHSKNCFGLTIGPAEEIATFMGHFYGISIENTLKRHSNHTHIGRLHTRVERKKLQLAYQPKSTGTSIAPRIARFHGSRATEIDKEFK